ncbi:MAG: CoA transferase [Rhodovarius sp.]|nr:CoA transferase [Rhodovarius sp.]MCX7932977.1 CoA transferase [Rhodovarius sp.]MDW8313753.1 CoA transferase [Rhodovarius sp.]
MAGNRGPLAGIRVLDMTSVVVGPICTRTLADQGADVIKVEAPGGDLLRQLGGGGRNPGMSGKFINFNRNKRAICLDLRDGRARAALRALIGTVDVFVSNIRPSSLARLGMDMGTLCAAHPRLIGCQILGFGFGGPYSEAPAYDTVIQAAGGVSATFEMSLGEPRYVPMVMADHITGLIAAQCIGFALYRRERTGRGEMIEVPMLENIASFVLTEHMGAMTFDPPTGPPGDARLLSPLGKPLKTKDGYISLSANTDEQAFAFFRAIGRPELIEDPRFCSVAARTRHTEEYFALRAEALLQKTTAEWLEIFRAADVPAGPYNTLEGLLEDPHLKAVGFIETVEHPTEGRIRRTRIANSFSGGMREEHLPAPRLGEHTREVLAEAGCSQAEIEAMLADGVAIQAE